MMNTVMLLMVLVPWGTEAPTKKVLMIGIDGCRPDVLKLAETPHLDALIAEGAFSFEAQVGPRTSSGPGWTSLLTGVKDTKHHVRDNSFWGPNLRRYPHLFQRLKENQPKAVTASIVHWAPIHEKIVTSADYTSAPKDDQKVVAEAKQWLQKHDPTWLFVHLDDVDGAGHAHGFSPSEPRYVAAIEEADRKVGELVTAVKSRPSYSRENWLILVTTDHGGLGTSHGKDTPEERTIFVIVSGPSAQAGKIEPSPFIWDVGVTALAHLGIAIDPSWNLDGRPVGLKSTTSSGRTDRDGGL